MPLFGERSPPGFPSGVEWASGLDGLLGTPTSEDAVIVAGGEAPDQSFFEEFPDSPQIERGEQATLVHRFKCDWTTGLQYLSIIGRGYVMEDAFGNDTYVLTSKLERRPGGTAEFTLTNEGINFDPPPDEFEVEPVEFNPPLWYHPRYISVRTYNLDADGNPTVPITGPVLTGFQIIQRLQSAITLPQVRAREIDVAGLNSTTIPDPAVFSLVQELLQKMRKGEDEFYMSGWKISYSQYFFYSPILNPGGYINDPVFGGELPYYFWSINRYEPLSDPLEDNVFLILPHFVNPVLFPSSAATTFSWLRLADQCHYQRTWFRRTKTWIGAPLGIWDPDVYPNYVNPKLGGP